MRAEITSKEKEEEDMIEKVQKEAKYESRAHIVIFYLSDLLTVCRFTCLTGRMWSRRRRWSLRPVLVSVCRCYFLLLYATFSVIALLIDQLFFFSVSVCPPGEANIVSKLSVQLKFALISNLY